MKPLGNMLLFQYLVNVLEQDFLPRKTVYKETMTWNLIRESFLNMLLGSGSINYKALMKDCLYILCKGSHHAGSNLNGMETEERSPGKATHSDVALATSLIELQKGTCISVQKFMIRIMELDMAKKEADVQGYTSRADGARTALVEIILNELTYDEDIFTPFLEAFLEPKWKLEIIVQYFWKYVTKPSVRTRRSNTSMEDVTFVGVLKCFSSDTSTKSIIKKLAQMLLNYFWHMLFRPICSYNVTWSE